MEAKLLLKQGWIRAILFVMVFLALYILTTSAAGWLYGNMYSGKQDRGESNNLQNDMEGSFMFINLSIAFLVSTLTVYFFRKQIDKQTFVSLGLALRNNIAYGATGFFLAIFLLGAGSFILIANDNLQWTNIVFNPVQLVTGLVFMFLIAFAEELMFRGYILNNLMQSMHRWLALVLTALLFAIFHRNNPGITPLALINVFLAGIVLGINYIYTKNLWFGILFHFSWNFYQGSILGYKVSGVHLQGLLEQDLNGNILLTGGPFGFEGSVINGILSLVTIALLAWIYEKKYGTRGMNMDVV